MTEPTAPAPAEASPQVGGGFTMSTIVGLVSSLAGGALGAGWPGVVALAALGFGAFFGINMLIKAVNRRTATGDLERAGAAAGETAVGLANQASGNRTDMKDLEKEHPPAKPGSTS